MISFLKYHPESGEVRGHIGFIHEKAVQQRGYVLPDTEAGEKWLQCPGGDPENFTVENGKVVEKASSDRPSTDLRGQRRRS